MALGSMIKDQAFGGNSLVRGLRRGQTLESALQVPGARFLPVSERRVGVDRQNGGLAWLSVSDLAGLGLALDAGSGTVTSSAGSPATAVPLYLLGQSTGQSWSFALDVTGVEPAAAGLADLRRAMTRLSPDDLAVAGQAAALVQWHSAHGYCPRCGAPTAVAGGGVRRQCTAHESHRLYPRTDPVVIMLVESPDGGAALLGRSKAHQAAGFLTCLSGFVDQCESIEEAVARETMEEAGLEVEDTRILGSQPWPIGK